MALDLTRARTHGHTHTYNPGVVIVGQHPLAQRHQQPEGILFFGIEQQHRRHDVHGLRWRVETRGSLSERDGRHVTTASTRVTIRRKTERAIELAAHLAVSDVWVSEGVGCEDPAQCGDAHLVLKGRVFGEGAVQVSLNLLGGQVVFAHGLLHQVLVVPGVGGHLVDRPCAERFTLL